VADDQSYPADSIESRFLGGSLDFETALSEVSGVQIRRVDLAQVLRQVAERTASTTAAEPALSEHDAQLLDESGLGTDRAASAAATLSRDLQMRELTRTALSVDDAVTRLRVTPGRVRQRITEGTLWAFTSGRRRMLPAVQFTDSGEVPYLDRVTPLLPRDLHPLTVQALLTLPRPELLVDGQPASIVRFLAASAGSAEDIAAIKDVVTAALWESA
jgi:hypothetical protein